MPVALQRFQVRWIGPCPKWLVSDKFSGQDQRKTTIDATYLGCRVQLLRSSPLLDGVVPSELQVMYLHREHLLGSFLSTALAGLSVWARILGVFDGFTISHKVYKYSHCFWLFRFDTHHNHHPKNRAIMPTYEDPGCCCNFCCPICAVYQSQGCACPEMALAVCFGCCYTMTCWDPTTKPAGAPSPQEMSR